MAFRAPASKAAADWSSSVPTQELDKMISSSLLPSEDHARTCTVPCRRRSVHSQINSSNQASIFARTPPAASTGAGNHYLRPPPPLLATELLWVLKVHAKNDLLVPAGLVTPKIDALVSDEEEEEMAGSADEYPKKKRKREAGTQNHQLVQLQLSPNKRRKTMEVTSSNSTCEEEDGGRLSISLDDLDVFLNHDNASFHMIHDEENPTAAPSDDEVNTNEDGDHDHSEDDDQDEELSWFASSSMMIDDHFMIPDMDEEEDGDTTSGCPSSILELNWDQFI